MKTTFQLFYSENNGIVTMSNNSDCGVTTPISLLNARKWLTSMERQLEGKRAYSKVDYSNLEISIKEIGSAIAAYSI